MSSLIEELFKANQNRIEKLETEVSGRIENKSVDFASSFVRSTLADAQASSPVTQTMRLITDARKSGEGAGLGTGLPAFYDPASGNWLDFMGGIIVV